jgi:primase-polymerase (primpol)-like protein
MAGGYDGVGYVFSKRHNIFDAETGEFIRRIEIEDPFTGIDLDHCLDDDGNLLPWAQEIVDRFSTRTEVSPSGKGVKLVVGAKIPRVGEGKARCRIGSATVWGHACGEIETYDRVRFFTMTGNLYPGTPTTIRECQELYGEFYAQVFPARPAEDISVGLVGEPANFDDDTVRQNAILAANGPKFYKLYYQGDFSDYTSGSEADQALCNIISFWTGPKPEQIDRIFRESAMCDDKWCQRADYRAATIQKAIALGKFYTRRPTAVVAELRPRAPVAASKQVSSHE